MNTFSLIAWGITLLIIGIGSQIDKKTGIIPNRLTYPLILLGIAYSLFFVGTTNVILSAFIFLAGPFVSKLGVGMGDIKALVGIQLMTGFIYGVPVIILVGVLSGIHRFISKQERIGPSLFYTTIICFLASIPNAY